MSLERTKAFLRGLLGRKPAAGKPEEVSRALANDLGRLQAGELAESLEADLARAEQMVTDVGAWADPVVDNHVGVLWRTTA